MKKTTQKKTLALGIIFLFLVSGVASRGYDESYYYIGNRIRIKKEKR